MASPSYTPHLHTTSSLPLPATPLPIQPHPPIPPDNAETFQLPDGRYLGYTSYGDSNGRPAFFFHGSPSSRLEAAEWHAAALKTGVRIIGVDRWGIGRSTLRPGATLLDWPPDISSLASHLGLSTFHVLGSSAGGPYALACAHTLPSAMLLGTGVVAGAAPPTAGWKGVPLDRRFAFAVNRYLPTSCVEKLLDKTMASPTPGPTQTEKVLRAFHGGEGTFCARLPLEERLMVACYQEAFRQGSEGVARDAKRCLGAWGFELGGVGGKVRLWSGTADVHVPVHAARWMAEQLERGVLKEFEGETHLTLAKHREEILTDLMAMGR